MMNPTEYFEQSKIAWRRAGEFPANKEDHYPDHAWAHWMNAGHASGQIVLEYGCGGGSDTLSYLRRGYSVRACDIVPENIAVARARIEEHRMFGLAHEWQPFAKTALLTESYPLPFNDDQFDVVHCHGVLHHIPDPAPVVAEFFRVLKPGGIASIMLYTEVLFEVHREKVIELKAEHGISATEAFSWCTDGPGTPYARAYGEADGARLLEEAGFVVEATATYEGRIFRTYRGRKPA